MDIPNTAGAPDTREPRQLAPHIESDPAILGGKPLIQGSRLSVEALLEQMASGYTLDDLLDAYPFLTAEDVSAALAYAAHRVSIPAHDEHPSERVAS